MIVVQRFQTDDGVVFDCRTKARRHEVAQEAIEKIKTLLASSVQTGRPEAVIGQLVLEADSIAKILQSYRKKTPKSTNDDQ